MCLTPHCPKGLSCTGSPCADGTLVITGVMNHTSCDNGCDDGCSQYSDEKPFDCEEFQADGVTLWSRYIAHTCRNFFLLPVHPSDSHAKKRTYSSAQVRVGVRALQAELCALPRSVRASAVRLRAIHSAAHALQRRSAGLRQLRGRTARQRWLQLRGVLPAQRHQ